MSKKKARWDRSDKMEKGQMTDSDKSRYDGAMPSAPKGAEEKLRKMQEEMRERDSEAQEADKDKARKEALREMAGYKKRKKRRQDY